METEKEDYARVRRTDDFVYMDDINWDDDNRDYLVNSESD